MCPGDHLLLVLEALASQQRLRIVAALQADGRAYVSQLARDIGISRPLLHLHLQKLEQAGLVTSTLELSADGKALKYYALAPFSIHLTPETVAEAVSAFSVAVPKSEPGGR